MCEVLGKFINNSIGSSDIFWGGAGIFREIQTGYWKCHFLGESLNIN